MLKTRIIRAKKISIDAMMKFGKNEDAREDMFLEVLLENVGVLDVISEEIQSLFEI